MPLLDSRRISARAATKLSTGTVIAAGALQGTARQEIPVAPGLNSIRADADIPPDLREALLSLEIHEQESIELAVASTARQSAGDDLLIVQPTPSPQIGSVQIILYIDESGGLSWHLPDGMQQGAAHRPEATKLRSALRARSGGVQGAIFTIPARTAAATGVVAAQSGQPLGHERRGLRGVATKIGRKVLKVLVVPLLSRGLAKPVQTIVGAVENRVQQERIRSLTSENYRRKVTDVFTDWSALNGRRALLVIHGIFSNTHGVLAKLPETAMREFLHHYGGRMIAFDQLTVSRSPEQNARFFLEHVNEAAPDGDFEFDILCHSRGGIVARTLAERGQELVPNSNCAFPNVFFVATPNRGSVLADPDHLVDMIDLFTNVAVGLPDGAVAYSIETLLAVLKLIVYAAETNLPGLRAMGTRGYIADTLNRSGAPLSTVYGAASSNYVADPRGDNGFIMGRFSDAAVDRVFKNGDEDVANDLVVPSEGVYGANGHPAFPIQHPLLFRERDRIWHGGFFERVETLSALRRHFGLPEKELIEIGADPNQETKPEAE